jgi:hypothetical protein
MQHSSPAPLRDIRGLVPIHVGGQNKGYLQTESYLQVSYLGHAIATNTFSQLGQRSWEGCCRSERINL